MADKGTRERILTAANALVRREGVARLTLDGAAAEAGLSKGGVLYYFRSKDELIAGIIEHRLHGFERELERAMTRELTRQPAGRWVRAYIHAAAKSPTPVEAETISTLLAAVATNPALLEPMREAYTVWEERAERDGLEPGLATTLRLAADGLWLGDLLGIAPPAGSRRETVVRTLLRLAGDTEAETESGKRQRVGSR